uniref:Uncharacterized protein n=1 Tax=Siphoviridae sp. ctWDo30 TaxID=2826360 RepID=A0A8S5N614_9CAUD|nr:MAG TPA: hypothetical protein [Siphoviridae sp. ctWDo30]
MTLPIKHTDHLNTQGIPGCCFYAQKRSRRLNCSEYARHGV